MSSKKETRNKTRGKRNILAGLRKNDLVKSRTSQNLTNVLVSLAAAIFYGVKFLNEKTKSDSKNIRSSRRKNFCVRGNRTKFRKVNPATSKRSKTKRMSNRKKSN